MLNLSCMLNLVFFGPPGVGKGTQAVKVARHYRLEHISTGDILREEIRNASTLGLKVKNIIERGELVSDELLIEILEKVCSRHHGIGGFIFDGFPRTIGQAEALDAMMERTGQTLSGVISLIVTQEELLQRLLNRARQEGRTDDTEAVIRNRLLVYRKHTEPLLDFYRGKGILAEVQGMGSIDEVFRSLCRVIDHRSG